MNSGSKILMLGLIVSDPGDCIKISFSVSLFLYVVSILKVVLCLAY